MIVHCVCVCVCVRDLCAQARLRLCDRCGSSNMPITFWWNDVNPFSFTHTVSSQHTRVCSAVARAFCVHSTEEQQRSANFDVRPIADQISGLFTQTFAPNVWSVAQRLSMPIVPRTAQRAAATPTSPNRMSYAWFFVTIHAPLVLKCQFNFATNLARLIFWASANDDDDAKDDEYNKHIHTILLLCVFLGLLVG